MSQYWFRKREGLKSKDMGWGYIPISTEGWLSIAALFILVILAGWYFDILHANLYKGLDFLILVLALLMIFSFLAKQKTRP